VRPHHRRTARCLPALAVACLACAATAAESELDAALASVTVPPPWLADVPIHYDTSKPWKEARQHIRTLLSEGKNREAIKLTWDYLMVRKVQEDTHEYPMYLYLGGEHAWATRVYIDRVKAKPEGHTFEYNALASLYVHYGEHHKAVETLETALERLPKPPWRIANMAKAHDRLGDVHAARGDVEKAKEHYRQAIRLFPQSKQPWGRHLLPRYAARVQAKLDLLTRAGLDLSTVRNGVHRGQSPGYAKPMHATVTVKGGRITDVRLRHQEKIDQGATNTVPRQIIERQGLQVDAVTGATVTVQAVVDAVYDALRKGGLK